VSELGKALKLARIACAVVVNKAGKNAHQNYPYVGHEHVLTSGAREALLTYGLTLVQKDVIFVCAQPVADKAGASIVWLWRGVFELIHESGEIREYAFAATTHAGDKAAYIASTALDRTAMLRVCQLAGGVTEDPEHDSNERFEHAAKRPGKVARSLDDVAGGGDHEERPKEQPQKNAQNTAPGSAPTVGAPAAISVTGTTSRTESSATTNVDWVGRHNDLCDEIFNAFSIASGAADEHGLHAPPMDPPVFAADAKRYPGKKYTEVPPGFLREVMYAKPDFHQRPVAQRLWASYLVVRHEIQKLTKGNLT
jgi:hypothetical protein